jgi:hypothetical protein
LQKPLVRRQAGISQAAPVDYDAVQDEGVRRAASLLRFKPATASQLFVRALSSDIQEAGPVRALDCAIVKFLAFNLTVLRRAQR